MFRHGQSKSLAVIVAVAASVALAACSSSTSSETSEAAPVTSAAPSTEASMAASASSGDDALAAFDTKTADMLTAAAATQTTPPPLDGPPAQTGKKVFVVPCAMVAQGCADSAKAGEEAAKAIGWDVTFIDPAGDPTKQNAAIEQAVSQGADGIFLTAIDAGTVATSLQRAQEAGLKVVCFACLDTDGVYDSLVPYSPADAYDSGYLSMAALYEATGKDLKVIMANLPEYGIAAGEGARQAGAKAFIADCQAAGGSCEIASEEDLLTANFTTTGPTSIVTAAQTHPEANALWAAADAVLQFIVPALQQADIHLKTAGIDPVATTTEFIRGGEWMQASVTPSLPWVGYAAVDNLNRMFAGQEAVDQNVKGKLITPENVPAEGVFVGDVDIKPMYLKSWGVN